MMGKVATSTWLRLLNGAVGDPNPRRRRSKLFTRRRSYNRRVGGYFKVLFVRHPLDRLVSAYYSKFAERSDYWFQVKLFT